MPLYDWVLWDFFKERCIKVFITCHKSLRYLVNLPYKADFNHKLLLIRQLKFNYIIDLLKLGFKLRFAKQHLSF